MFQNKCIPIPSNLGKNVFLFQLSKCIPIPGPGILMYSDSWRNGYHPKESHDKSHDKSGCQESSVVFDQLDNEHDEGTSCVSEGLTASLNFHPGRRVLMLRRVSNHRRSHSTSDACTIQLPGQTLPF